MIVNEDDIKDPAYSLVPNRRYVPLPGITDMIRPSFVYLRSNDNPALETFREFIESLS